MMLPQWNAEQVLFCPAVTKTSLVGYGRHLLASAPAPASDPPLLLLPKALAFACTCEHGRRITIPAVSLSLRVSLNDVALVEC